MMKKRPGIAGIVSGFLACLYFFTGCRLVDKPGKVSFRDCIRTFADLPFRHTCEGGYPFFSASDWIPADAGMTNKRKSCR